MHCALSLLVFLFFCGDEKLDTHTASSLSQVCVLPSSPKKNRLKRRKRTGNMCALFHFREWPNGPVGREGEGTEGKTLSPRYFPPPSEGGGGRDH